jgi:hypothetical protein
VLCGIPTGLQSGHRRAERCAAWHQTET